MEDVLSGDILGPEDEASRTERVRKKFWVTFRKAARVIPFSDRHRPAHLHPVLGDSIARWEGDTLVIETIGLPAEDRLRAFPRLIVSAEATVVERYTRVTADELLYQFTVIDPAVYDAEWLGEYSLTRTDGRMYSHECHEGNYSLENILKAGRQAEVRSE